MTNPPHDGDERDAGTGDPWADPDRNLTQPVQPYDRPAPPPGPPQQYGRPQYGPSAAPPWHQGPAPHGQPAAQYGAPQYGRTGYGQPPYGQMGPGQPAYGPPGYTPHYGGPAQPYGWPPEQPRKSKLGLIAGLTVVALLIVAGVVVTLLALKSTVLDPAAVERDVAAQFEQREGVAIDLTCGDDMEVHEGGSYRCTGVTADGEEVTLQITITDEETAAYTWTEP
jgi:hypothetical protein